MRSTGGRSIPGSAADNSYGTTRTLVGAAGGVADDVEDSSFTATLLVRLLTDTVIAPFAGVMVCCEMSAPVFVFQTSTRKLEPTRLPMVTVGEMAAGVAAAFDQT